jgi:hypothetical protein
VIDCLSNLSGSDASGYICVVDSVLKPKIRDCFKAVLDSWKLSFPQPERKKTLDRFVLTFIVHSSISDPVFDWGLGLILNLSVLLVQC